MNSLKNKIMDAMETSSQQGKKRMTVKNLSKKVGISYTRIKKDIRTLIEESRLFYWTSGSTCYVVLKKDYDEIKDKEEMLSH